MVKMSNEINSVRYILNNYPIRFDQMVLFKNKGRPTPDLSINSSTVSKTRTYKRVFNKNVYNHYEWMCGCPVTNKLFCFMCILFRKEVTAWTLHGVSDLKHLADRAKKHEESVSHIQACMDFSVLGRVNIREQLSSVYLQNKLKHNENVEKNRHVLKKLIMCIKFCGAFELALRGHDERISSDNPGIYLGLINLTAELDSALDVHMKEVTVFRDTSKTIRNELLDSMFEVYRNELIDQIKSAKFVAVQADETTDSSNQQQMVIVIRYVYNKNIRECFWSFVKPEGHTAEQIAKVLRTELQHILHVPNEKHKLIAQSYNGASVMSGKNKSAQAFIRETFPHAYFIHCYAHQANLLMEQVAQCNKRLRVFFANLQSFESFFLRSLKRTAVLDEIVKRCFLPHAVPTRWSFKSTPINTLYEYRESFQLCLETIIDADRADSNTINEACGLLNHLKSSEFRYWLKLFHFIMPHVEIFFNQTQTRGMDSFQLQKALEQFEQQMMRIRSVTSNIDDKSENQEEVSRKRQTCSVSETGNRTFIAKEVCDTILEQIKNRFNFKGYLSAAKLFDAKNFKIYGQNFPQQYFDHTVASYPMLDSAKLKTELTAIYTRDDMCAVEGVLPLLIFIAENNLKNVLSETFNLLDIICTTPMSTSECERCFSTMKRIKTFLRNTVTEDKLTNALAILSIEKKFIQSIPDFDNKVLEVFCKRKDRSMRFLYKEIRLESPLPEVTPPRKESTECGKNKEKMKKNSNVKRKHGETEPGMSGVREPLIDHEDNSLEDLQEMADPLDLDSTLKKIKSEYEVDEDFESVIIPEFTDAFPTTSSDSKHDIDIKINIQ